MVAGPPVLVLEPPGYSTSLGVVRSLGRLGVRVHGLGYAEPCVARVSRYYAGSLSVGVHGRPLGEPLRVLADLTAAGRRLGEGTILIPASDEWTLFIAAYERELSQMFGFPRRPLELVDALASKAGLYQLSTAHGFPTPRIAFPQDAEEAASLAENLIYPIMLKPIYSRPGQSTKAIAVDAQSLLRHYRAMEEDPKAPNLLFQEYIPGRDQDVWMFDGYFDGTSRCLFAMTGYKVRQHPAHMGNTCLGVCQQNETLISMTSRFLSAVGYRGIVDIGFRFDARDGQYKVIDVNPRVGLNFRQFVDANGLDTVRSLYLDMTGQPVPTPSPRDGRRWIKEDFDLIAVKQYRRDGLSWGDWLRSLRGLEEGATFSRSDPLPFFLAMFMLARQTLAGRLRRRLQRWRRGAGLRAAIHRAQAGAK